MPRRLVQLINDAKEIAQALEKNDLSIYSFNRALIEMVPVKEFVRQMEKSLQMIKELYRTRFHRFWMTRKLLNQMGVFHQYS